MEPFQLVEESPVPFLVIRPFREAGGVLAVFSTRSGGVSRGGYASLNVSFHVGDAVELVRENRARLGESVNAAVGNWVVGQQVHGATVALVDEQHRGRGASGPDTELPAVDALATKRAGLPLVGYYADCQPVYFFDPVKKVAALAHAGRKGLRRGILKNVTRQLQTMGTTPSDCLVALGPAIGPCCYEVGGEVYEDYLSSDVTMEGFFSPPRPGGRRHFNLPAANMYQLLQAGIDPARLWVSGLCTVCHPDLFFSYRREERPTGRMGALLMLLD